MVEEMYNLFLNQVLQQQQQMDQQRVVGAKNVFNTNQLMAHIQQLEPLAHHKVIHQEKQIRTLQQVFHVVYSSLSLITTIWYSCGPSTPF